MKTYTATSQNSRNFILENENQEILGELIYPKWYSTKAEIHIGSKIFKTDTKGFWTTSVEVTEYERVLLKFKMDWKGNIIMTSLQDGEKHFIIKKEKWYSNILVMKDENEKVYFHLKRSPAADGANPGHSPTRPSRCSSSEASSASPSSP